MATALEICVESVESAVAAQAGGADRIELCGALLDGGLTPSIGLLRAVRAHVHIPIHVLVRPRAGGFFYSASELEVMALDIENAREAGAEGVVIGVLEGSGEVDISNTQHLVSAARPMQVTFHRAIDMTPDLDRAFEDVIRAGADRVLTSGGEQTALRGCSQIARLVQASVGRIGVTVGGNVRYGNVGDIRDATGASEYHAALSRSVPTGARPSARDVSLGDRKTNELTRRITLEQDVRKLRERIRTVCSL